LWKRGSVEEVSTRVATRSVSSSPSSEAAADTRSGVVWSTRVTWFWAFNVAASGVSMTDRRSEDECDMVPDCPYGCSEKRAWLSSGSEHAYPSLLPIESDLCSLAPRGVLCRLGLCLVLALAGVCYADPIHGPLGERHHSRRLYVKSKPTNGGGRVQDDSVAVKRHSAQSCQS